MLPARACTTRPLCVPCLLLLTIWDSSRDHWKLRGMQCCCNQTCLRLIWILYLGLLFIWFADTMANSCVLVNVGACKHCVPPPAAPMAQCATQTSGWNWTTWRWPKLLSPAQRISPPCFTLRSMWTRSKLTWRKAAGTQSTFKPCLFKHFDSFIQSPLSLCFFCRTKSKATRRINFEENSQTFTISSLTEKSVEDTSISLQVRSSWLICVLLWQLYFLNELYKAICHFRFLLGVIFLKKRPPTTVTVWLFITQCESSVMLNNVNGCKAVCNELFQHFCAHPVGAADWGVSEHWRAW